VARVVGLGGGVDEGVGVFVPDFGEAAAWWGY